MMKSGLYVSSVHIRTDDRTYQPGELVEGLSETDMEYLIRNGFVGLMNGKELSADGSWDEEDRSPDHVEPDVCDDVPKDGIPEEDLKDDVPELYTEDQLNKLPSKKAIAEYAESIGLSGLDTNLHKPELIDRVLAYIGEVQKRDDI